MSSILPIVLLAFLVVTAVVTAWLRDVLAATVVFGAYSLGMAIAYVLLRAPDVGLTEAAVGAGVTTALLLVTIARTNRPDRESPFRTDIGLRSVAVVLALVAVLLATVPALPAVGDPGAPGFQRVAPYYLTAAPQLGISNVVTAVLVAFRGFDTIGEIVVVVTAGIAVLAVLGREEDP